MPNFLFCKAQSGSLRNCSRLVAKTAGSLDGRLSSANWSFHPLKLTKYLCAEQRRHFAN